MDNEKRQYINTLKSLTTSKIKKIRVEHHENTETILMEMSQQDKNLRVKLIKWFIENPYPDDNKVHEYAEKIGMNTHELESHIYSIISSVLSEGKSKGKDIKHDPKQLDMGIEVEMEHTSCPTISRKIALDHLVEIPDYYSRLKEMEKAAGIEESLLYEIFIQAAEVESMPKGKERDIQILRLAMIAELDAVNLYDKMAGLASDKRVRDVMLDISREEKVHSGEFEELMELLDPDYEDAEEEGEDEVEDIIKK